MAPHPDINHETLHRELVERLAGRLTPVRRIWPVSVRLTIWLLIEALVLLFVVTYTPNDFMLKLHRPAYLCEVLLFSAAAIYMAALALKSAIPGRYSGRGGYSAPVAMALAGTVLLFSQPAHTGYPLSQFIAAGVHCACYTFLFGAAPLLALWLLVKRAAPTLGATSGALIGSAALFFSFAVMRLGCPIDDPLHLLTWHLGPVLIVIGLASFAGSLWLRLRPRRL